MRVIVTRPPAQAAVWVEGLRERGVDAVALPLMAIEPLEDTRAIVDAAAGLARHALVMFVSANAVEHFFAAAAVAAATPGGFTWPADVLAGATGPGTVAALRAAGVPPAAIVAPDEAAGRFDSEALWQRLAGRPWAGRSALVVRGEQGRDWLAEQLQAAGAQVGFVAAYRRAAPQWRAEQRALAEAALAAPAAHLWSFSSSEAARHLPHLMPRADWRGSAAAATHERIAEAVREVGFGAVTLIAPDMSALAALVRTRTGDGDEACGGRSGPLRGRP